MWFDIIITGWNLCTCRSPINFLAPLPGIVCFIQVYFSVLESLFCFDSVLLTGFLFVLFSICEETNQNLFSTIRNPNSQSVGGEPIRTSFISMVSHNQFGGSSPEDPHAHLERFVRNCSTYRNNNVTQ